MCMLWKSQKCSVKKYIYPSTKVSPPKTVFSSWLPHVQAVCVLRQVCLLHWVTLSSSGDKNLFLYLYELCRVIGNPDSLV